MPEPTTLYQVLGSDYTDDAVLVSAQPLSETAKSYSIKHGALHSCRTRINKAEMMDMGIADTPEEAIRLFIAEKRKLVDELVRKLGMAQTAIVRATCLLIPKGEGDV